MKKNKKNGFTIVEVVVSMALIAIVLATAFLFCSYTISAQNDLKLNDFFLSESEKIVNCYYAGETNYSQNVELSTGVSSVSFGSDFDVHYDSDLKQTTIASDYCYDFSISFEGGKIIFEAKVHSKDKIVFQKEVTL